MLGYLTADIICSEQRTVFRERSSRKTVSYEEQIMSKDKYPSIFSRQMGAIVFTILQIFFARRAALKTGEYPRIFPSFSWGIFAHVTRLDQSRASEKIWWIIIQNMLHINTYQLDYEQSLCFLIVRRERSEKNRPRESWLRESCCLGERRKKRDYRESLSVWLMRCSHNAKMRLANANDSDESDDRPKLTGRQDKGNNWITVN